MAYQPSAADFEDINDDEGYTPSAEDFEEEESGSKFLELALTKASKPQELKGWKGLGHDVIELLRDTFKGGIGFARRAPGNLKEIGKDLIENPLSTPPHIAQQVLAGLAGGTRDLLNVPHKIFDELADKEITPNWLRTGSIPEDLGVEKALGLEATKPSDELLRALPGIYGGGQLLKAGINKGQKALAPPDLKQSIRETQNKVNQATNEAGKIFDTVEKEVGNKGLQKVSIDKDIINKAETFLAKTPANKDLIKRARTGDYKALRSLQADLRVKGEKALSSALSAENTMGEEILSTRDQINHSIQKHLESTGHEDLAKLLNKARKDYGEIKATYFSTPALAKVFGKSQKVPKNPKTLLTEESTEMKRFMSSHPEVKQALSKALEHDKKMGRVKSAGKVLGIGTTAEVAREIIGGK